MDEGAFVRSSVEHMRLKRSTPPRAYFGPMDVTGRLFGGNARAVNQYK